MLLRLRQKYGKGLNVAYYRDVVRPRILKTRPIVDTNDTQCEIHVLTSRHDWLNLIWALKSFYVMTGRNYSLCIHEDGSLSATEIETLKAHFPAARVIQRSESDARVLDALRNYPLSLALRKANQLALKVFDFKLYLQSDRMVLFDSDLLFFAEPAVFLRRADDGSYRKNTLNRDIESAYTIGTQEAYDLSGVELLPAINSGFGLIHSTSLNFEWVEEFLSIPSLAAGHFWRIEQTLYALCSSRYGFEHLPEEYNVRLHPGLGGRPFRHYVGAIRHLMYSEGMRALAARRFLEEQLSK
jgi:hypothetical protein